MRRPRHLSDRRFRSGALLLRSGECFDRRKQYQRQKHEVQGAFHVGAVLVICRDEWMGIVRESAIAVFRATRSPDRAARGYFAMSAEPWATNAAGRAGLAEACRNRTNLSTLPRRNNGFEDRGSHQTPFASSHTEKNADDNIRPRGKTFALARERGHLAPAVFAHGRRARRGDT